MFPHSNHLPAWLYRLLIVSGTVLLGTGLLWEALHYVMGAGRGEGALPHPGEAWLMRLHAMAVIAFTLALGGLGPVHIPRGWREKRNQGSGVLLILLGTALLLSGYSLNYWFIDDTHALVGLIHTGIGLIAATAIVVHLKRRTPRVHVELPPTPRP